MWCKQQIEEYTNIFEIYLNLKFGMNELQTTVKASSIWNPSNNAYKICCCATADLFLLLALRYEHADEHTWIILETEIQEQLAHGNDGS
jgi:hypothetical protein